MEIIFKAIGVVGLLLITRGILTHKELKRDEWSLAGGMCLLAYSIYQRDIVFIALQTVYSIIVTYEIFKLRSAQGTVPIAVSTDEVVRLESGDKDL